MEEVDPKYTEREGDMPYLLLNVIAQKLNK